MQVVGVDQLTVGIEDRVADDQGDVEVSFGQQRLLVLVVDDVRRDQTAVHLFGGPVHGVVVVPQGLGRLVVRVAVVLVLGDVREVVRVTVILRQRRRPMQVHGGLGR